MFGANVFTESIHISCVLLLIQPPPYGPYVHIPIKTKKMSNQVFQNDCLYTNKTDM